MTIILKFNMQLLHQWIHFVGEIVEFLYISHRLVCFYLKQSFGDWILPPSSGKSLLD
jgi:hypothetical protein